MEMFQNIEEFYMKFYEENPKLTLKSIDDVIKIMLDLKKKLQSEENIDFSNLYILENIDDDTMNNTMNEVLPKLGIRVQR